MSNHTLLTIGAFMILTSVLLGFYNLLASTGDDIGNAQEMILATTIATSYVEIAQGLAFDQVTDTSHVGLSGISLLTPVANLGPDGAGEDSIQHFNDFDDFNGLTLEKTATGTTKRFTTTFKVFYVNQDDVSQISATPTFIKRLDLETWRSFPPGGKTDTLRISVAMGYFHFD
jgi:hypothetical protein